MGVDEQSELQAGDVVKATLTLQPQRQQQASAATATTTAATSTLPSRGAAARSARHSKSLDQLQANHQVSQAPNQASEQEQGKNSLFS